MIAGRDVAAALARHGFDFYAGVPCSLVEDVLAVLEAEADVPYVAACREDAGVGVAAGAWFAGRRPVVIMQNSGLGTSLNALASLSLMYGLPALLLVTWRGFAGKDAPEHLLMGDVTPRLLETLGVPYRVLGAGSLDADLAWCVREMDVRPRPVALLVPPGIIETGGVPAAASAIERRGAPALPAAPALVPAVSRFVALRAALKALGDEPVVHANGYICRESYAVADRPQSFYMIGSMGLAPAIALGLSLASPTRAAVTFDGDGNLLMNLGILAMVGAARPPRFVHVVFDNEAYGSTGNQRSPSAVVRLDRLAAAAGYRTSVAVTDPGDVAAAVRAAVTDVGPHFILVKVTAEEADVPRIPYPPETLRERFAAAVRG